jgi:hypothetical protein
LLRGAVIEGAAPVASSPRLASPRLASPRLASPRLAASMMLRGCHREKYLSALWQSTILLKFQIDQHLTHFYRTKNKAFFVFLGAMVCRILFFLSLNHYWI